MVNLGDKFGKLTVISSEGKPSKTRHEYFKCLCECGNTKSIRKDHLNNKPKGIKSCGCLYKTMYRPHMLEKGIAGFNDWYNKFKHACDIRKKHLALSKEFVYNLTQQNCHYCNTEPNLVFLKGRYNGDFIYNGIDRVDNTLGYVEGNVVSCCKMCNIAKASYTKTEFLDWINQVYRHQKGLNWADMEVV